MCGTTDVFQWRVGNPSELTYFFKPEDKGNFPLPLDKTCRVLSKDPKGIDFSPSFALKTHVHLALMFFASVFAFIY